MIAILVKRMNRWRWLLRYWVLDKHREQLRPCARWAAAAVVVVTLASGVFEVRQGIGAGAEPVQAVINIWIQLAIMVISALISYAMRPKVEGAKPQTSTIPEVEDGKSIVRIYGTVWIDDSIPLAWKQISTEPIKKKGKK